MAQRAPSSRKPERKAKKPRGKQTMQTEGSGGGRPGSRADAQPFLKCIAPGKDASGAPLPRSNHLRAERKTHSRCVAQTHPASGPGQKRGARLPAPPQAASRRQGLLCTGRWPRAPAVAADQTHWRRVGSEGPRGALRDGRARAAPSSEPGVTGRASESPCHRSAAPAPHAARRVRRARAHERGFGRIRALLTRHMLRGVPGKANGRRRTDARGRRRPWPAWPGRLRGGPCVS